MSELPREPDEKIIELSLKHVIVAFGGLVISLSLAGTSIVLVRDYVRYKRQEAYLNSVIEVLLLFKGGQECINETKKSSSPRMTLHNSNE
jgi:hypothetical protein